MRLTTIFIAVGLATATPLPPKDAHPDITQLHGCIIDCISMHNDYDFLGTTSIKLCGKDWGRAYSWLFNDIAPCAADWCPNEVDDANKSLQVFMRKFCGMGVIAPT